MNMADNKLEDIATRYRQVRSEISSDIRSNIEKMSNLKGLKEVQVSMLSLRQRLLEENHILIENLSSVQKKYRAAKAKQMEDISTNMQHRYQYNEKNVLIEGKTANIKEVVDTIENQISFFVDINKN